MINLNNIDYNKTKTWPSYREISLETNIIIADFIKKIYVQGVFEEINKLMTSEEYPNCDGVGHIVLISICSAIDSLSAYSSGGGNAGNHFKGFITKYFPNKYYGKEDLIYKAFRCDGVHGWNLHKSIISGKPNDSNHLKIRHNIPCISLYDFFNDLTKAFYKFYNELRIDDDIKNNVLKRYKDIKGSNNKEQSLN